jgi:hypothetical protein
MPELAKYWVQRVLRPVLIGAMFLLALSGTVRWQQKLDAGGCGRHDEACASFALAEHVDQGQGLSINRGEHVLLMEDSFWRVLLAGLTRLTHQPSMSAYLLGAVCGLVTLLLGMQLAARFGYHPVASWFFAFALLFSPGWLSSLVEGQSTPLAAALVMWVVWNHVERMERQEIPLSPLLMLLLTFLVYVRLEFAWLWGIFLAHHLLNAWRARAPFSETPFLLLRGFSGVLLLVFLLLPLAAWHWPLLGWPPLRIPEAPVAIVPQPVWQLILAAIPKAYAGWVHSPYWSAWVLTVLAAAGAFGLALRAWKNTEARSAFIIPLLLVLMPLFYALSYPITGWFSSEVVFAAFDPISVLACAVAASRVPDWIARLMRRQFFLHAVWISALRVAVGLLLSIAVLLESTRWNVAWSSATHARAQTRQALKHVLTKANTVEHWPLVLTDEPGWVLWATKSPVIDLSGRLTADFIGHHGGRDFPKIGKLRERMKVQPGCFAILWNKTGLKLVEEMGFKPIKLTEASTDSRWPVPQVFFRRPSGAP